MGNSLFFKEVVYEITSSIYISTNFYFGRMF